ncbi:MAG: hypothetical protein GY856_31220, partial [bacterium]|nr:hypothetical protein [bacterium]
MTGAIVSPSRRALLAELAKALPTLRHVAWEPAAFRPEIAAAHACYGDPLIPRIHPEQAGVILSLGKDFLGTEDEGGASIRELAAARRVRDSHDSMARLYVAEGRMSLTGSNADHRLPLRPSRAAALAFAVARELHDAFAVALPPGLDASALAPFDLDRMAGEEGLDPGVVQSLVADLAAAGSAALVVAGDEVPPAAHVACHLLNAMLGGEGSTVDSTLARTAPALASCAEMEDLARDMASGSIAAAVLWDVNPLYALPDAAAWREALSKVPLRVSLSLREDETTRACQVVLPVHHWLEAWGDHEPGPELVALQQPVVEPLFDTRQGEDVLLEWLAGLDGTSPPFDETSSDNGPRAAPRQRLRPTAASEKPPASYRDFIRRRWQRELYPTGSPVAFDAFWNAALHDGFLRREPEAQTTPPLRPEAVVEAARTAADGGDQAPELVLHPDVRIWDGRHANNGWLQELPEPVSKTVWGNALSLSPADARDLGIDDGDEIEVDAAGRKVRLAALVQPGQAAGVVSAALGYGRRAGSVGTAVGVDVYPLLDAGSATPHLVPGVKIVRTGGRLPVVRTQEHHHVEGRDIARAVTLTSYAAHQLEHPHHLDASLYPEQVFPGPKWGMVIDLNACVGCSGCVIACQSENNIPVVGPEQ